MSADKPERDRLSVPSHERHDLWKIADGLQMDLRAAQAKLVELRAHLAALSLPDPTRAVCPDCGLVFSRRTFLAEHLYHTHDGPEPPHWLEAEARAEPDPDDIQRPELPRDSGEVAGVNGLTTLEAGDDV